MWNTKVSNLKKSPLDHEQGYTYIWFKVNMIRQKLKTIRRERIACGHLCFTMSMYRGIYMYVIQYEEDMLWDNLGQIWCIFCEDFEKAIKPL